MGGEQRHLENHFQIEMIFKFVLGQKRENRFFQKSNLIFFFAICVHRVVNIGSGSIQKLLRIDFIKKKLMNVSTVQGKDLFFKD